MRTRLLAMLLLVLPLHARAEALFMDLSTHRIEITSHFVGQDLTLFGTVVVEPGVAPPPEGYDLVALVRGPEQPMVLRRKEPVFGLWISREVARLPQSPASLYRLSTGPVDAKVPPSLRRSLRLDLDDALTPGFTRPSADDMAAVKRLMAERGLLRDEASIDFAAPSLFRATLRLPGALPTGAHTVDLYLFAKGALIGSSHSGFVVEKSGFSADLALFSLRQPLIYGLGAALMALFFGWFAATIFRRD